MASSSGAGFTFEAASVASTNTITPLVFGSTGSPFSFSSPAVNGTSSSAAPSLFFGNPNPFGNNFQMSMEDSMEEDQAVVASINPFGFASQPAPSRFMYNSSPTPFQSAAVAPTANSFQFASQQSLNTSSPSQASSSLGSFSFGARGGDKSTRKMIKVRKGNRKRSGRGRSASFAFGVPLISALTFGRSCSVVPSSSVANSRGAAITSCSFSWQQPSTSPTYTAALSLTSMAPSSGARFTCGAASVASTNTTPPWVFGSMGSPFSFSSPVINSTSSSAAPSPIFGKPNPFGNYYQMSMEDSMEEDNTQAVVASTNPFGYASRPAPSGFMYNSSSSSSSSSTAAPPTVNSFQFASQQSLNTPSPFQLSCSLGSISLGNSGGDKSIRKMIKVRKGNRKK